MSDVWKAAYSGRALQRGNLIIRVQGAQEIPIEDIAPDVQARPAYQPHIKTRHGSRATVIEASKSQSVEWIDYLNSLRSASP